MSVVVSEKISEKLSSIVSNKYQMLSTDMQKYILNFSKELQPLDISSKFPQFSNFILEIGAGWGEFTLNVGEGLQKEGSPTCIIAIEKRMGRVVKAVKEQKKRGVNNIFWLVLDIDWFFENLFVVNSFSKIIINFPDPWPKKRHQKNRFFSADFLDTLTRITFVGATLEFLTDYYRYAEQVLYTLEEDSDWLNRHTEGVFLQNLSSRIFKSRFEKQKIKDGEHIYALEFIRA